MAFAKHLCVTLACCAIPPAIVSAQNPSEKEPLVVDVLLTDGTIHVGDGSPGFQGDLALRDDRIVAVGDFQVAEAKRTIDCSGLIISPGFIDLHTHSDNPVVDPETRAAMNYLAQGCTTMVTGNCGSGPIEVDDFYQEIERHGAGTNVAHLLPQGALRRKVLDSQRRQATADELEQMRKLADKAMQAGAWGMSTGLIYVPSSYADQAELTEIARVVSKYGGIYVSHIRNEGLGLLEAIEEATNIGKEAQLPVHISHFKSSGQDAWGLVRTAIEMIDQRRQTGQVITADQYPYTASSTSLSATTIPSWARAGGRKATLQRIRVGNEESERIRKAIERKLRITDDGHRIQIASNKANPQHAGRRLDEIAADEGVSSYEMVIKLLESGGAKVVNHSINELDVRYVMQQAWVATASDGSAKIPNETIPHPRSYGTFARKIGHYSLREGVIPIEQAIRSCCELPARILGMEDRGLLKEGLVADIAVWDPDSFLDQATFESPHQYAVGMRHVWVNGILTIHQGYPTGALGGKALRHPDRKNPTLLEPKP